MHHSAGCGRGDRHERRACRARPRRCRTRDWKIVRQSRWMCASAASASGARPRLVCRITPVALITGRSECPSARRSCSSMAPAIPVRASCSAASSSSPEAISLPQASEHRARCVGDGCNSVGCAASTSTPGMRRTSSTDGSSRKSSDFAALFIDLPGLSHENCAAYRLRGAKACADTRADPEYPAAQRLAIAGHFFAAETDDIGDALVVGGQPTERKIFVLENSLQPGAFFAAGGIGLVAAVAARVVDFAASGLLRVEAKFRVGLATFDVASGN